MIGFHRFFRIVSTHSRPKAAGSPNIESFHFSQFQHTAARRRLGGDIFFV